MSTPHRCPVCNGHGYVSYPPGIADGQPFSSSSAGPWPCHACEGGGIIWETVTFGLLPEKSGWSEGDIGSITGSVTRATGGTDGDG